MLKAVSNEVRVQRGKKIAPVNAGRCIFRSGCVSTRVGDQY